MLKQNKESIKTIEIHHSTTVYHYKFTHNSIKEQKKQRQKQTKTHTQRTTPIKIHHSTPEYHYEIHRDSVQNYTEIHYANMQRFIINIHLDSKYEIHRDSPKNKRFIIKVQRFIIKLEINHKLT